MPMLIRYSAFSASGWPNFAARDHVHREFDVHRRLERVAGQFAVALRRMAVAQEQQRARMIHRQVDGRALDDLVVVHVAAEPPRVSGADRRSPAAAQRRRSRASAAAALKSPSSLSVGFSRYATPFAASIFQRLGNARLHFRSASETARARCASPGCRCRPSRDSCGSVEPHHQRVAGHRALDIERTGLRIAAGRAPLALRIVPPASTLQVFTVSPA